MDEIKHPYLLSMIVMIGLTVATLTAYWQVQDHAFVNYDDYRYVIENRHVKNGLSMDGILWAFSNLEAGFWHPLTWLSHMLDCQMYGLNPRGHHFNSLLLHIANTLLLFLVLKQMTKTLWRSAFVAALFALHPLHVESVAWVSQRKDLLSTTFWILTMWTYLFYTRRPSLFRYLSALLCFAFGLMAKTMLVTLPVILLLMDYWPLKRLGPGNSVDPTDLKGLRILGFSGQRSILIRLFLEKIPFLALSILAGLLTLYAEGDIGALPSLASFPLESRIANALLSYIQYIGKMVWPSNLAVIYLHPPLQPLWEVIGSCILLGSITVFSLLIARSPPYYTVGWLWYILTLLPVIGLIQIGSHALADRYTYIPLIGLFLIVAWMVPDLLAGWRYRRIALIISSVIVLQTMILCTWFQVRYWQNSFTLFGRAIAVNDDNFLAHNNLGFVLSLNGGFSEAIYHYKEALRINPGYVPAHYNLANALQMQGKSQEAISQYKKILEKNPQFGRPHYNLGNIYTGLEKIDEAIYHYSMAIKIDPEDAKAHNNLSLLLIRKGKLNEAIDHLKEALRINPEDGKVRHNLETARRKLEESDEDGK